MNDESRLREYFASLRRAEMARTPRFERVMSRARHRPTRGYRRFALAASMVLVAVTGMLFWGLNPRRSPASNAAALMLVDWRAPTDFLLATPGRELLHTIPDMGGYPSSLGPVPPTRITTPAPRTGREHS